MVLYLTYIKFQNTGSQQEREKQVTPATYLQELTGCLYKQGEKLMLKTKQNKTLKTGSDHW